MNCCVVTLSVFSSDILTWGADILAHIQCQGRTQRGWVKYAPLSLIFYKNLITCAKEINWFSHTICLLICRLPWNLHAKLFLANNTEMSLHANFSNIVNGPKVIIRFR